MVAPPRILFVMAAEAEYGPALRARIDPLMTGIGPIEAAIALTHALIAGPRPDLVVSLGSAGSARLRQGAVYQVSGVAWRDIDASPLGFAPGEVPFLGLPRRLPLTLRIPGVPQATLSTGADIVSGPAAYARIPEDMVDMESYAHLRACQRAAVPMIGLRGISDGAVELGGYGDWTAALPHIDAGLAKAVDALHAAVGHGGLAGLGAPAAQD